MLSLSVLAGSGCLEKLKRGLEAAGRVDASFAVVGRNERLSMEAALAPLTILHISTVSYHIHSYHVIVIVLPISFVPLLRKVLRRPSRSEGPLVPRSDCCIIACGRWPCSIDGIRGARLAQSAAIIGRLLEFANSVFCVGERQHKAATERLGI